MRSVQILLVVPAALVAIIVFQALTPPDVSSQGPMDVQATPTPTRPPETGKPAAPAQKPAVTPATAATAGQPGAPRATVVPVSLPRTGAGLLRDSGPALGWILLGSALAAVALGTVALASRARRRS